MADDGSVPWLKRELDAMGNQIGALQKKVDALELRVYMMFGGGMFAGFVITTAAPALLRLVVK